MPLHRPTHRLLPGSQRTWRVCVALAGTTAITLLPTVLPTSVSAVPSASADTLDDLGSAVSSTLWGDGSTSLLRVGGSGSGSRTSQPLSNGTSGWDPTADLGSMYSLTKATGAQTAWSRGYTGKDVTVAVIDTGVAPVPGLDRSNKVFDGPDLSFEGQAPGTRYLDGFGHGTHLAGIIAGQDDGFDPRRPSAQQFDGVAPDAKVLNMKVGTGDGGADVTQVIAALDWVTAHRRDQGLNVRVVSLAYGTESTQPWQVDPLAKAVENAWDKGIVVVTAAGNDGTSAPNLLMPAIDPHVIAVGAVDHEGTASQTDDTVADFTSGGTSGRRPDVLAPGKSVVSLRVPGSWVDLTHPEGLVAGDASGRYFRGSGTSQATAVVAGEVALLLQAKPGLTPDQVKRLLKDTADPLARHPEPAMGAGVVDVNAALDLVSPKSLSASVLRLLGGGQGSLPASTGTGSLEASRGGEHVVDPSTGDPLVGELDAQGSPWDAARWARSSTDGSAWAKGSWNGRVWTGDGWDGQHYRFAPWEGTSWNGVAWSDHEWSSAVWEARSWRNDSWLARSWREANWLARSWRGLP